MAKDISDPIPAKYCDLYPEEDRGTRVACPLDADFLDADILDADPIPAGYPYHTFVEIDDLFSEIPITFEDEDQWKLYWEGHLGERERMNCDAIFHFYFPEITEAQIHKISWSLSIELYDTKDVYEKVKGYYLKRLNEVAQDQKLLEAVKEAARDREPKKKGKRGNGRQGLTQKEAIALISEMGFKQISDRQIRNWNKGINAPPGYPGLNDAVVFRTWLASAKIKEDLKIRVVNMGPEEMAQKKRR